MLKLNTQLEHSCIHALGMMTVFLCVFMFFAPSAQAQPLGFLLQRLGQTHPAVQSQYEQVLATEATTDEARAGYFPSVSANANYGYQERERTGGLGASGVVDSKPVDTSLSISQNIFEGFRTDASISSAEANSKAAEAQFYTVKQQVFLEAIASYIDLLKQRHLLQLSQQNIQTLQNQVALEQERMVAGTGISVDVLTVKSRLQFAHERYANFLGSFQQAEARFIQFFDMEPDYRTLRLPSLGAAALPQHVEAAIQISLMRNPNLKQVQLEVEAANSQKDIAKAGYFPRLDVVASSSFTDGADDITGETTTSQLQLRGSWELFSGFADQAREKRAIHGYQSALASAEDTRRQVIETTKRNWSALVTSRQRVGILQNAVNIAQQVYAARMRLRDIGNESAINVLNAESELFSAQINATAAQYDGYLAAYQLLQSIGTLELSSVN